MQFKHPFNWSYSSLKTFQQCPKKYYHLRVAKDVKDEDSTATLYGKELHLAAEEHIRDGKEIPVKFNFMADTLQALNKIPGEKHCEIKLGLALREGRIAKCEFFAKDVWWRGVADLLIVNNEKKEARLIDYKTSKNAKYADTKQLDILAAAVFTHFPQVETIKSGLLFVVSNEFVKKDHERMMRGVYLEQFEPDLKRIDIAMDNQVWNPISGPLCKFCPVKGCTHNKKD